eukprot:TRINITY_DN718_c0_g1_i1.p1 TRINITY_DN718_c0_g1~~TRINITY_DN718_c0_g1_i1.p1  ORF type:complete len:479 (+),score=171.06 TRINITY_DN718_c0_g1_i1:214-1437(+)
MSNKKECPGNEVFIVECVRTPIARGYANGAFHNIQPSDLLALTLKELVKRAKVDPSHVEDVIAGCVTPIGEQGANIARIAVLKAGFPDTVPGVQLNRMCGSSQQAIHFAAQAIASGDMDVVIACGVESMSRVPMGSDSIFASGQAEQIEEYTKNIPYKLLHQGYSAELIAEKWNLKREDLEKLAGRSHERNAEAGKKGYFKKEIVPVTVKKADGTSVVVDKDEGVRVPVDYKKLSTLKTVFKPDGVITAGVASQISDGAAAVLLVSARKAKELGLTPRARFVSRSVVGSHPELMLTGPIPASQKALQKAGLSIDQIDVVEINEAFASVVLAWQKELNPKDLNRVNPNGGAIGHGHPLGATGAVLMTKMVHELERSGGRYGLQTMCIGHGQATATIIENLSASNKSKL